MARWRNTPPFSSTRRGLSARHERNSCATPIFIDALRLQLAKVYLQSIFSGRRDQYIEAAFDDHRRWS